VPRGYAGTLLVMLYGSAISVLVIAVGVGALLTEGIKSGGAESAVADETQHRQGKPAGSPADISLAAENLGNLRVRIDARVTMNAPKRPLGGARVEAFLDMIQMPGAHSQGPLYLRSGDNPGVYSTVATVPMVGDYEVRVQMNDPGLPVYGEAKKVVSVGVVGTRG
jgi:hypothetical protein